MHQLHAAVAIFAWTPRLACSLPMPTSGKLTEPEPQISSAARIDAET